MEIVEELMATRRWRNMCLRANIVTPDKIQIWNKTKLALTESNAPVKTSRHDRELTKAIEAIAPEWWGGETRLCLNRNVQCEKHKDGNKGHSYVLFLGDFVGGALLFEDGQRLEEKYTWHKIDGQKYHWNEPHEGTKYSIILYKGAQAKKKTDTINLMLKRRREGTELGLSSNSSGSQAAGGASEGRLWSPRSVAEAPALAGKQLKEVMHIPTQDMETCSQLEINEVQVVLPTEAKKKRVRVSSKSVPPKAKAEEEEQKQVTRTTTLILQVPEDMAPEELEDLEKRLKDIRTDLHIDGMEIRRLRPDKGGRTKKYATPEDEKEHYKEYFKQYYKDKLAKEGKCDFCGKTFQTFTSVARHKRRSKQCMAMRTIKDQIVAEICKDQTAAEACEACEACPTPEPQ